MKVILIEDNKTLANGISKKLHAEGFLTEVFNDGEDGLYALETFDYDVLILDLGLPNIDGIDIIKQVRHSKKKIPILIISARDKLDQRILGLNIGADDYLCKPFELDEVIARIKALLRRSVLNAVSAEIKFNDLTYDTDKRILSKKDERISLNKRELNIIEYLLLNANGVSSKEDIINHITAYNDDLSEKAVEIHVCRLRKKLNGSMTIKNLRGIGYVIE